MPLGLGAVSALTGHGEEYVAWGWAVNGFASVIGSVLTTIIAMMFGFNVVLALAVAPSLGRLVFLPRRQRPLAAGVEDAPDTVQAPPAEVGAEDEVAVG